MANKKTVTKADVIVYDSEDLRKKSPAVKFINGDYASLGESMLEILRKTKGVGLAGPQVGVPERMFVVRVDGDHPKIYINPTILETSEKTTVYEEGCLSLPGVWEKVIRPETVRVQAWNEKGRAFTLNATGLLARVIQHEYDHLEGVLFIDRLSEVKRQRILSKYERVKGKAKKW